MDRTQIVNRAWRAYLASDGGNADQPIARCSGEQRVAGLHYVVLRSDARVLAVYRVKRSGALRRMKRWPLELGRASASPRPQAQINSAKDAHV